jgi:hypothetical protein
MRLGGQRVANDGTVLLRPRQRVLFSHIAACRHVGDTLTAEVLRGNERLSINLRRV